MSLLFKLEKNYETRAAKGAIAATRETSGNRMHQNVLWGMGMSYSFRSILVN